MARSRNIKPGFFTNDVLGELPALTRLLFAGLWTICDREGRIEDRPKKIRAEVLPYDACDADEMLNALSQSGFIDRYEVDGVRVIQVLAWDKHQNPHIKEGASTLPAKHKHQTSTVQEQCNAQPLPELAGLIPDSLSLDSLISDTKGESASHQPPAKRAAPTKPEPFEIPEWVNPEHWATWHSCPKRRKATNEQKQLAVNKLDAWRLAGQDFAGALENAAVGGYQGLFLPDEPRVNPGGETAYQRSMREKMEVMAPAIAAKAPGVPRTNPNNFFDALPNAKPLEITQ